MPARAVFLESARREARRLGASHWDLAMISWVPLLALMLIWWIFSSGVPNRLPIGVLDADRSTLSRQLLRFLDATPGLSVHAQYTDPAAAGAALRGGSVYAVVRIPDTFTRDVKRGHATQVTLLHNAQFGTHSGLIQRDVRTAVTTLSVGIEVASRARRGESALAAKAHYEPLHAATVTLFNTASNYEQFLGAALIPALLHIFAMTAGAWGVGRELRDRTLPAWVGAAPKPRQAAGALLGKLLWPLVGLAGVGAAGLYGATHGGHAAASLAWTLFALVAFIALSIAMGAFAAATTASLRLALSVTGFITAPAFAFSGVGFPLVSMSPLARGWANALPFTHYIRVQIEQLQMAAPLRHSLASPLWMLLATVLLLGGSAFALSRLAQAPQRWGKR